MRNEDPVLHLPQKDDGNAQLERPSQLGVVSVDGPCAVRVVEQAALHFAIRVRPCGRTDDAERRVHVLGIPDATRGVDDSSVARRQRHVSQIDPRDEAAILRCRVHDGGDDVVSQGLGVHHGIFIAASTDVCSPTRPGRQRWISCHLSRGSQTGLWSAPSGLRSLDAPVKDRGREHKGEYTGESTLSMSFA